MKDWLFLLGFNAFALFLTMSSWDYPFISALYPRMLLACGFVLSGIKVVLMLRSKSKEKGVDRTAVTVETSPNPKRMWIYLGSGILYILLMPDLGFILSSLVILIILLTLFGIKLKTTLSVAVGTSLALYLIFVIFLGIPMPKGVVESLLF